MNKRRRSTIISATLITLSLATVGQMVYASTKEPGTKEDPMVTMSYVDLKLEQLKDYIDQKIALPNQNGGVQQPSTPVESATYEVVELKAGKSLIAEAGTEVILRSGEALAIVSPLGGLSDVTGAKDLKKDEKIPANHLLIIPRADGRGVRALVDCFLMVRGGHTIK